MSLSGVQGGYVPPEAFDAIASIRSTSPFAAPSASSGGSVADSLDSLMQVVTSPAMNPGDTTDLAILRQLQNAQQSTIDLFA